MIDERKSIDESEAARAEMFKGDHWLLASDPVLLDSIDAEIQARLIASGWDEETAIDLMLGVREAMINAIKHGNLNNPEKKVKLDVSINSDEVKVEIEDEGTGFDTKKVREINTESTSGRGIDIYIKPHFQTSYNEKGNRLTLTRTKKI